MEVDFKSNLIKALPRNSTLVNCIHQQRFSTQLLKAIICGERCNLNCLNFWTLAAVFTVFSVMPSTFLVL